MAHAGLLDGDMLSPCAGEGRGDPRGPSGAGPDEPLLGRYIQGASSPKDMVIIVDV